MGGDVTENLLERLKGSVREYVRPFEPVDVEDWEVLNFGDGNTTPKGKGTSTYDLIGDIHGHADALEHLLKTLDYRCQEGVWSHPKRQVIFPRDFVDRGPRQVDSVCIARKMVEAGSALAVMGNHEFNAVAWATPDPDQPDEHLRAHTQKNRDQHRAYLKQVGEGSVGGCAFCLKRE